MTSPRQIRVFFGTMVLAIMLVITIAFNFGTANSWAATNSLTEISQSPLNKVENLAQDVTENVKDKIQLQGRAKAVTKNIEGQVQETIGNTTGNHKDQIVGKAKQVEGQARNLVEDIKDQIRDILH